MAELDYAFIADYAQIEGDKLSAIGASFTHVSVNSTEGLFILSVAGRVRMTVGEPAADLGITLRGADSTFEISNAMQLEPGPLGKPYQGDKLGVLFATGLAVPIYEGLYEIFLSLNGTEVRRLAFDIALAD